MGTVRIGREQLVLFFYSSVPDHGFGGGQSLPESTYTDDQSFKSITLSLIIREAGWTWYKINGMQRAF